MAQGEVLAAGDDPAALFTLLSRMMANGAETAGSGGNAPVHVGGSSLAAARRAGRRGDGYFPGGRLTRQQRAEQITVMRADAAAAGRDPAALEYTRWGQIDMTADEVAARASQGVTRLVVSPGSADLAGMRAEISAFARRLGLG